MAPTAAMRKMRLAPEPGVATAMNLVSRVGRDFLPSLKKD